MGPQTLILYIFQVPQSIASLLWHLKLLAYRAHKTGLAWLSLEFIHLSPKYWRPYSVNMKDNKTVFPRTLSASGEEKNENNKRFGNPFHR